MRPGSLQAKVMPAPLTQVGSVPARTVSRDTKEVVVEERVIDRNRTTDVSGQETT